VAERFNTIPFDVEQLNAAFLLHNAFYPWCRDATKETHNRRSTG